MPVTADQIATMLQGVADQNRLVVKHLERLAAEPAPASADRRRLLQGWDRGGSAGGSSPRDWPAGQLKAMQPYSMEAAQMYLNGAGRGLRRRGLLGWGPMLIKMGAVNGISDYQRAAREMGWTPSYGEEQLEKEFADGRGHGPLSVRKAAKLGAPWEPRGSQIIKTALSEASGQAGGYLIPPQYQADLLAIQAEEAFIKPRCRVQPMTGRVMQWPSLDVTTNQGSGVTPYLGGIQAGWQPEAALINEYEPAFRLTDWTAWDLILYAVSSNQLLQDNGIGLDALMTMLFGQAITWFEEYAYLQGKGAGSSQPLGVLNSPCTILQTRNTANRFLLADAAAMFSHLQVRSWDNACWIMHQSVLPQLIQMVGGGTIGSASTTNIPGNMLVWINPWAGPGNEGPITMKLPQAFLNGLPVYFTEKLPSLGTKGDVMLVDFAHYIIGQRLDTQIDISPHYLFRNNQLAWRVWFRCDGKFWLNGSITDQAGWNISPAIVLN